ncbi:hypothetical protein HZA43_05140 [Candidatus Peregrinibacteria bacterium]|nr:hypothetical protein [Candidatus Peregrinibacteria bacterium]
MKKSEKPWLNMSIAAILLFLIGGLTGYGIGFFRAQQAVFPEIKAVPDINPGVAMIQLLEVKNGELKGRVSDKKVRIAYSPDNILDRENRETFSIPLSQITLNKFFTQNTVPEGALYVASSQGEYYYSVLDKQAFSIAPKNRLFFGSAAEAEGNGYRLKK